MLLRKALQFAPGCTENARLLATRLHKSSALDRAAVFMLSPDPLDPRDSDGSPISVELLTGLIVAHRIGKIRRRSPLDFLNMAAGCWGATEFPCFSTGAAMILQHGPGAVDALASAVIPDPARRSVLSYGAWLRVQLFAAGYLGYYERGDTAFMGYSNALIAAHATQLTLSEVGLTREQQRRSPPGAREYLVAAAVVDRIWPGCGAGLAFPGPDNISAFTWGILAARAAVTRAGNSVITAAIDLLRRPGDTRSVVLHALDVYLRNCRPVLPAAEWQVVTDILDACVLGDAGDTYVALGYARPPGSYAQPATETPFDIAAARSRVLNELVRASAQSRASVVDALCAAPARGGMPGSMDNLMASHWLSGLNAAFAGTQRRSRAPRMSRQEPPSSADDADWSTLEQPAALEPVPPRSTFPGRAARRRKPPLSD